MRELFSELKESASPHFSIRRKKVLLVREYLQL